MIRVSDGTVFPELSINRLPIHDNLSPDGDVIDADSEVHKEVD